MKSHRSTSTPRYFDVLRLSLSVTIVALLSAVFVWTANESSAQGPTSVADPSVQASPEPRKEKKNRDDDDDDGGSAPSTSLQPSPSPRPSPEPPRSPEPPPTRVSGCAQPGQETVLTLILPGGSAAVIAFPALPQPVRLTLEKVEPASLPPPPGRLAEGMVFNLLAEGCEGGALTELPAEVNLSATLSAEAASGLNRQDLILALYDGAQWLPAPKLAVDPNNNFVAASVARVGTYGVHQR